MRQHTCYFKVAPRRSREIDQRQTSLQSTKSVNYSSSQVTRSDLQNRVEVDEQAQSSLQFLFSRVAQQRERGTSRRSSRHYKEKKTRDKVSSLASYKKTSSSRSTYAWKRLKLLSVQANQQPAVTVQETSRASTFTDRFFRTRTRHEFDTLFVFKLVRQRNQLLRTTQFM